ncbi:secretin and TonB N-terminal domain-containing protein [Desulfopila inferna]|uniref:secretin and TonB N-terminal domain-containing protein n=1 Tax=Desulfopila inferna TaxID=468528 RepID=UPI0019653989|nr:secretin and TonB N-terminal domain-containing protein [Desulfopila inferna]MBM9606218.1 secretin and TonB N-terminal domain-containing protein [Desulfopila inferna]
MYKRLIKTHLAVFSAFCFLITFQINSGNAADQPEQTGAEFILSDVTADKENDSLTITLVGSSAPAYTSRELYDPYRLVIDIADVTVAENLRLDSLLPENNFVTLQTAVVRGLKPEITRFIFTLQDGYQQKVERQDTDLVIHILPVDAAATEEDSSPEGKISAKEVAGADKSADTEAGAKIRELIESSVKAADPEKDMSPKEKAAQDLVNSFDFSGYEQERISIDFYKMDLHNVFRLFRQVSGMNLIVDEGVSGSLTLALNDVPWDFALDIILNLSDLEKEEKFNTIVVYPKDKEFEWPKRASDNLSFEANLEVVQQESLIIEQSANQPKEIIEAKELMRKARAEERENNYENAVQLYEEAAELWPTNVNLTNRLAGLYLVRLGMNAKAVFYAKESLKVEPDNYKAALYAAIGQANMNQTAEALEYFSRSVSGDPPMKEALASFAAFSESNGRLEAALKLFDKYHEIYGETVNTMVARARILDKLGMDEKAADQYQMVLASGYPLQVGLKEYIQSRLSEARR